MENETWQNHLQTIAKSYDAAIEAGKKGDGEDPYQTLPEMITSAPGYQEWKTESEHEELSSGRMEVTDFLKPEQGMKFIDLGCCVNLMFRGYDKWPSTYYGVDISKKTIEVLQYYVKAQNLTVGEIVHGSIHETPFADNMFDIGSCIGVLEYYNREFAEKALQEMHRILKSGGRIVLDIPNIASLSGKMMMQIEGYLDRPEEFDLLPEEFEELAERYFIIEQSTRANSEVIGYLYCLRCRKSV